MKKRPWEGPFVSKNLVEDTPPTNTRKDGTMGRIQGVKKERRPAKKAKLADTSGWGTMDYNTFRPLAVK